MTQHMILRDPTGRRMRGRSVASMVRVLLMEAIKAREER